MTDQVIDASALCFALIGRTAAATGLRTRLRDTYCHAPHLIDAEVGNMLRKRTRTGDVSQQQARTALGAARDIIDLRYPHTGALAAQAWDLRGNLTFYDALYVALAARLGISLLTGDRRLSRAPQLPCAVDLV